MMGLPSSSGGTWAEPEELGFELPWEGLSPTLPELGAFLARCRTRPMVRAVSLRHGVMWGCHSHRCALPRAASALALGSITNTPGTSPGSTVPEGHPVVPVPTPHEGEVLFPFASSSSALGPGSLPASCWALAAPRALPLPQHLPVTGSSWASWGGGHRPLPPNRTQHPQVPSPGRTGLFPLSSPWVCWSHGSPGAGVLHPSGMGSSALVPTLSCCTSAPELGQQQK